jgi:hypothetical protein
MDDYFHAVDLPTTWGSDFLFPLSVLSPTHKAPYLWDMAKITNLTNGWVYSKDLWVQDGSWDYWTPIYMLNRIIRLQAVVENYNQLDCLCLKITGQTTAPNVCHYIPKPPGLRISSSWGRWDMWQIQPFRLLPSNCWQHTSGNKHCH